jgi:hypothetical protein
MRAVKPALAALTVALLAAPVASPALAQQPADVADALGGDVQSLGLESIMNRLDLTEESESLVEPAVVEILEKHTDLMESAAAGTADKATLERELAADRERTHERLRGVLNADQFEELGRIQDELGAQVLARAVSL